MDKILLIGGSGFLGLNWINYNSTFDLVPTFNSLVPRFGSNWQKFSFDDKAIDELKELIMKVKPDVVVNCAAMTSIEACNLFEDKAYALNFVLPKNLAQLSKNFGFKLVHISTDQFASESLAPRSELEKMTPLNVYGRTKLNADENVALLAPDALILRVNFFGYGSKKKLSLLDQIIKKLSSKEIFYGYADVFFNPISAKELVQSAYALLERGAKGLFNISSIQPISKFDFAIMVSEVYDLDTRLVVPSLSDNFQTSVQRVKYLPLSNEKFLETTGILLPPVRSMLIQLKEDTIWQQLVGGLDVS
jgi:dTDP-4-dehydrorhamnose reductase